MINSKAFFRILAAIVLMCVGGCAPAYHSYSGCHIDCRYCPPHPLPFCNYNGCRCHSLPASNYLTVDSSGGYEETVDIAARSHE